MRMNYKTYPTDYIQELKQQGKRKKARAFMEYWDDMEMGDHHSVRFYAESWDVSVGTAFNWISEFKEEIDKFLAHWQIKNQQHYNYAKKSIEHQSNDLNTSETRKQGKLKKAAEQELNEDLNIYDDDNKAAMHSDQTFNDIYFTYSINTKFKGKKEDAYKEWIKIKDSIKPKELKRAIVLYLHDPEVTRKYNLANFLKNEVYLSYMSKKLKIIIDGKWIIGEYDMEKNEFRASNGKTYTLYQDRFIELYKEGKLEFVR